MIDAQILNGHFSLSVLSKRTIVAWKVIKTRRDSSLDQMAYFFRKRRRYAPRWSLDGSSLAGIHRMLENKYVYIHSNWWSSLVLPPIMGFNQEERSPGLISEIAAASKKAL